MWGSASLPWHISGARPDIVTENGNLAKNNVDVRLYDLKGPAGLWAGWFDFANTKGGTTSAGVKISRQRKGTLSAFATKGSNGTVATTHFRLNMAPERPAITARRSTTRHLISAARKDFWLRSLCSSSRTTGSPSCPSFVYQRLKDGNPRDGWNQWVSFGARPEVFFTKYLSLAMEAGADQTSSPSGHYDGWLRKVTIAPQIGAGRKFFSRPVLRAFLTYADWSDGFRGLVGGPAYLKKTAGLTYGVQAETWW